MGSSRRALRAGRVGRPHGLDGSFHVAQPLPELLEVGASVIVGARQLTISRRAGTDQRPIVRLAGLEDRDAARSLGGEDLLVPQEKVRDLEENEWWAEDLEGCTVHDGDRRIGVVRRLLALPSCEALEVARQDTTQDLLVPLVTDAVRGVDLERKKIEIDLRFLGED
jgi:16S rRNA processing protein RimM